MRVRSLFLIAVLALLLLVVLPAAGMQPVQAEAPFFKQVAGPASDITAGLTALPVPEQLGLKSRAAMLPVHLVRGVDGRWRWQTSIPLDTTEGLTFVLLSPEREAWNVQVEAPGTDNLPLAQATVLGVEDAQTTFGLDGNGYPATVYRFAEGVPAGMWRLRIEAPTSTAKGATPDGYLIVATESPYRLYSHLREYNLRVGERIGLVAYVYDNDAVLQANPPAPVAAAVRRVYARVRQPDGREFLVPMYDDGRHGDRRANDGVYGGDFLARQTGEYTAQVILHGVTPDGAPFVRTNQHLFPVIEAKASLGKIVVGAPLDEWRLRLNLPVGGLKDGTVVQAYAEVWGIGAAGKPTPAAWIGGMVEVRDGIAPLSFDTRWLGYANVRPPYELRNVRLLERETHIPLATANRMSLRTFALPKGAWQSVETITEEMLMGPRPNGIAPQGNTTQAAGGKLLLVHGYCAGGNPWPVSHFTNYAVFQDYNQNRSHDQFARLIRDFGAQFPSFGIVAHSQGGAASLHLYTYYWSGLDYSSGSRLIQSVGTPYQGTALAGSLALIGEIFGVGCGTNWDLTYDGAALWLSGIPSWARSKVHYWTTSDKDVWWRWDYCSMATDPILDDPEDGVVERWAGQLPYGVNHGHKEGWCHTSSMRDPAQTTDYSRNVEMNAYGNR